MKTIIFCFFFFFSTNKLISQDSTIVEKWDNGIPSVVHYYETKNGQQIKTREAIFYTSGEVWEERINFQSSKTSFIVYDTDGDIRERGTLNKQGNSDGHYIKIYKGEKEKEGEYVNGYREGVWKQWYTWYPGGKLKAIKEYKRDKVVRLQEWYESGIKREFSDNKGNQINYDIDGKIASMRKNINGVINFSRFDNKEKRIEDGWFDKEYNYYLMNYWDGNRNLIIKNGNGIKKTVSGCDLIPVLEEYKNGRVVSRKVMMEDWKP